MATEQGSSSAYPLTLQELVRSLVQVQETVCANRGRFLTPKRRNWQNWSRIKPSSSRCCLEPLETESTSCCLTWVRYFTKHWVHGKRAVVEPARMLTAQEVIQRVCDQPQE